MNDFFNSLNNNLYDSLNHLDKTIHKNSPNNLIDNFINELKDYLIRSDINYRLSKLPQNSILEVNEIEENYLQCYVDHVEYSIPKDMIYSKDLDGLVNNGWLKLQLKDDGLYHIIDTKQES